MEITTKSILTIDELEADALLKQLVKSADNVHENSKHILEITYAEDTYLLHPIDRYNLNIIKTIMYAIILKKSGITPSIFQNYYDKYKLS